MRAALHPRPRLRLERLETRLAPSFGPVGPEFRVNQISPTRQISPSVAANADGEFVVVWNGFTTILAQRFNADGSPLGQQILVESGGAGIPDVAMDAQGNFVVAWDPGSTMPQDVYARRYDAAGSPLGARFLVNTFTTDSQSRPSVAMSASGDFVIAWSGIGPDGPNFEIYARRYSSAGSQLGGEFRVNTFTEGSHSLPAVAIDLAGNFAIAWGSEIQDGSLGGVYAQRFSAAGTPLGEEFRVNTFTDSSQGAPEIAVAATGEFIVAWQSDLQDGSSVGVYAQRFSAAGIPLGDEFRVNTYTLDNQSFPGVALTGNGDFVIVWQSNGQDGSSNGIYSQRYDPDGTPLGGEFLVNTTTTDSQFFPSVAAGAGGDFVVVWTSGPGVSVDDDIYAQRYGNVEPLVVQSVAVNDGAAQRSRISSLAITFSTQVTFNPSMLTAFTLTRNGGSAVGFSALSQVINGVTRVTISDFTGPETLSGSLRDGRYTLTALASQISANGTQMASNYTFGDAQGLFRFYGDINGDRRVDISDFGFFSLAYLNPLNFNSALDFNGDGRIDIADFGQFSVRFFTTLP